jgi:Ca2+-binding EF-hand superfamily protein
MFDLDEDGFISQAEMLAIVDSIYRMVGQSQPLPEDEATAPMRVEKVFKLMDLV